MATGLHWMLIILFVFHLKTVQTFEDRFSEELIIKTLPTRHLYTHFQFTTLSEPRIDEATGRNIPQFKLFCLGRSGQGIFKRTSFMYSILQVFKNYPTFLNEYFWLLISTSDYNFLSAWKVWLFVLINSYLYALNSSEMQKFPTYLWKTQFFFSACII